MAQFTNAVLLCLLLTASGGASAGAANAQLDCKGVKSGKNVTLSGSIPGDFADFQLDIAHDGQTLKMQSERDVIHVVTAFRKGKFHISVALADGNNLRLAALPKSIAAKGSVGSGALRSTFKAVLSEAPAPFDVSLSGMNLSCRYDYAI